MLTEQLLRNLNGECANLVAELQFGFLALLHYRHLSGFHHLVGLDRCGFLGLLNDLCLHSGRLAQNLRLLLLRLKDKLVRLSLRIVDMLLGLLGICDSLVDQVGTICHHFDDGRPCKLAEEDAQQHEDHKHPEYQAKCRRKQFHLLSCA